MVNPFKQKLVLNQYAVISTCSARIDIRQCIVADTKGLILAQSSFSEQLYRSIPLLSNISHGNIRLDQYVRHWSYSWLTST